MFITGTGVDSPITKKSRGSRPLVGMPIFIMILQENEKIKLHLGYKSGFSFSKVAFRIQKLRFVYKYSVVKLQNGVSSYKVASRFSIKLAGTLRIIYLNSEIKDS
jgi:hypothetical protein